MIIITIDPGGNFTNGKGTTAFCKSFVNQKDNNKIYILDIKEVKAKNFNTKKHYFNGCLKTIKEMFAWKSNINFPYSKKVIIENFLLFKHKRNQPLKGGDTFETTQLITFLQNKLTKLKIEVILQNPSIKAAMKEKHLVEDELIYCKNNHHYYLCKSKKNQSVLVEFEIDFKIYKKILSPHLLDTLKHLNWYVWQIKNHS